MNTASLSYKYDAHTKSTLAPSIRQLHRVCLVSCGIGEQDFQNLQILQRQVSAGTWTWLEHVDIVAFVVEDVVIPQVTATRSVVTRVALFLVEVVQLATLVHSLLVQVRSPTVVFAELVEVAVQFRGANTGARFAAIGALEVRRQCGRVASCYCSQGVVCRSRSRCGQVTGIGGHAELDDQSGVRSVLQGKLDNDPLAKGIFER